MPRTSCWRLRRCALWATFSAPQLTRLRAQIICALRRGSDAPPLLLDATNRLAPLDSGSAREAYLEALGAAIFAGRDMMRWFWLPWLVAGDLWDDEMWV